MWMTEGESLACKFNPSYGDFGHILGRYSNQEMNIEETAVSSFDCVCGVCVLSWTSILNSIDAKTNISSQTLHLPLPPPGLYLAARLLKMNHFTSFILKGILRRTLPKQERSDLLQCLIQGGADHWHVTGEFHYLVGQSGERLQEKQSAEWIQGILVLIYRVRICFWLAHCHLVVCSLARASFVTAR